MKKLVVLAVVLAVAALFVRGTVHYGAYRLHEAVSLGDVAFVEQHADLKAFAALPVDVAVLAAESAATDAAGSIIGAIAGAVGQVIGGAVKDAGQAWAVDELKGRIQRRQLAELVAGFAPNAGLGWFGGTREVAEGTLVKIVGSCESAKDRAVRADVALEILFQRMGGPVLGYPADWRAAKVDKDSLKAFVQACRLVAKPSAP